MVWAVGILSVRCRRVQKFRHDYQELKKEFEKLKNEVCDAALVRVRVVVLTVVAAYGHAARRVTFVRRGGFNLRSS